MLNIRIQQNVRIDFETVEKLMDIKAKTGKSITEMYNEALKVYVDFESKLRKKDPHSVVGMAGEDFVPPVEETKKEGTSTFAERAAIALGDNLDEEV